MATRSQKNIPKTEPRWKRVERSFGLRVYRAEHRKLGLCIHCDEPSYTPGALYCLEHAIRKRVRQRKKRGHKFVGPVREFQPMTYYDPITNRMAKKITRKKRVVNGV